MKAAIMANMLAESMHPRGVAARVDSPDLKRLLVERSMLLEELEHMIATFERAIIAAADPKAIAWRLEKAQAAVTFAREEADHG